jgi:hypothetical protein
MIANKSSNQIKKIKMETSDWISGVSAIFALVALIISIIATVKTNTLAKKDYLLTHRPFVWIENFGYLDNKNLVVNPVNQVMIRVLNSPATFLKEYYEYYIIDDKGNKTIVEKQEYEGQIRYPDDKSQYTNTSSKVTDQIYLSLQANQQLERIIKIEYAWLSSEKTYFFEATWKLDKQSKTWKIVTQNAN